MTEPTAPASPESPAPEGGALDTLTTEELRRRAFEIAERKHDIGFFWNLVRHMPESRDMAIEDGSPGPVFASITEAVTMLREMFGGEPMERDLGDAEPLVRGYFVAYIESNPED